MNTNNTDRYERAIKRNLAELNNAVLKRKALIGLHNANSSHALDFFRISAHALFNDLISHTIKVFELSPRVASFWYVVKVDEAAIKAAANAVGVSTDEIEGLSQGFKHVRDKTHFHIDKDAVLDPGAVWKAAGITGDDLGFLLESTIKILCHLYKDKTGQDYELPDYDGKDAEEIIKSYVKCNPDVPILL